MFLSEEVLNVSVISAKAVTDYYMLVMCAKAANTNGKLCSLYF